MTEQELNLSEETLTEEDELTLEDLQSQYINNPKVGEEVEFIVKKILKITGNNLIVKKKDGGTFSKALSKVDYGYEIHTDTGATYTISSWEVFGKLKAIFQKLGKIKGTEVRIKHVLNGMESSNKGKDAYEVAAKVNGKWKTLDRETKEWE